LVVPPTKTYIQAFAVSEVLFLAMLVVLTILVALSLGRRLARGEPGAGAAAWSLSALATLVGVLGFRYVLGVGLCLLLACASMRRPVVAPGGMAPGQMSPDLRAG
jgi:hypothetical protein